MKFTKKKWSAPKKIGFFIVVSMIVIFFFESLGISNREFIINKRIVTALIGKTERNDKDHQINQSCSNQLNEKINSISEKNRIDHIQRMLQMLIEEFEPQEEPGIIDNCYDI